MIVELRVIAEGGPIVRDEAERTFAALLHRLRDMGLTIEYEECSWRRGLDFVPPREEI